MINKLCFWFQDWIYPGYNLKNLLFKRYDLIKIPILKPWEYAEPCDIAYYAAMEPIKRFIESNPEKHVDWYNEECKYGISPYLPILYPELKGKFAINLIKEIYQFYTKDYDAKKKDVDYILSVWSKYVVNYKINLDDEQINQRIYSFEDEEIKTLDWELLNKYVKDRLQFFNPDYLYKIYMDLEAELNAKKLYYMHLAVEMYHFLWL